MDTRRDYEWSEGGQARSLLQATDGEAIMRGVPVSVVAARRAAERLALIKAECKRRIYAQASAETQMNMNAVAATLAAKTPGARSAEENGQLAAHASALGWVKAMREACEPLAVDPDSEWRTEAAWPAPPADAVAFAQSV